MSRWFFLAGSLLLLGIVACTPGLPVNTDYDQTVNFAAYKTYKWQPADPDYVQTLNDTRVQEAVNRALLGKGLKEVKEGEADLVVGYQMTKDEVRIDSSRYGWWKSGEGESVHEYKDGMLILDMVDPAKDQHVWHGTADNALIGLGEDPNKINYAVEKLLHGFPPPYKEK